jgi:hypothetical protein
MWADAIAETREAFEPRRLIAWGRWGVAPPAWRDPGDDVFATYLHQERLFRRGRVVWGCFVQANHHLYRSADQDAWPAVATYGLASELDAAADILPRIAAQAFALKGTRPDDPDLRGVGDLLAAELTRGLDHPLPRKLTLGRELATTSVMVHREHLPTGYLTRKHLLFPLLVDPETHASLVLPAEYWSSVVIDLWTEAGAAT